MEADGDRLAGPRAAILSATTVLSRSAADAGLFACRQDARNAGNSSVAAHEMNDSCESAPTCINAM
jgi:hypothetical protein